MRQSVDRQIARNVLLKARKPPRYKYDDTAFENFVEQITGMFSSAQEVDEGDANATVESKTAMDHQRDLESPSYEITSRTNPYFF